LQESDIGLDDRDDQAGINQVRLAIGPIANLPAVRRWRDWDEARMPHEARPSAREVKRQRLERSRDRLLTYPPEGNQIERALLPPG
jgi:hypothetical protein